MPTQLTASPNTAENAATITPSDSTVQPVPFRAIWVGTGGDINVQFSDGRGVTFKNVPSGYMFAVGGIRVNATNTTASNLVAVY